MIICREKNKDFNDKLNQWGEYMEEKEKNLAKQMVLEDIITKTIQIPGVKVNRKQFLAEQFASKANNLEEILDKGPIEAGIKREDIKLL